MTDKRRQATSTTASNLNRLGVTSFTLEAWVKRAAGGVSMSTGTGGLEGTWGRPQAYPVVAKGMGEGETPANINTNWFLGITTDNFVGADFEDTADRCEPPGMGNHTRHCAMVNGTTLRRPIPVYVGQSMLMAFLIR